jgi:hypothetical protein
MYVFRLVKKGELFARYADERWRKMYFLLVSGKGAALMRMSLRSSGGGGGGAGRRRLVALLEQDEARFSWHRLLCFADPDCEELLSQYSLPLLQGQCQAQEDHSFVLVTTHGCLKLRPVEGTAEAAREWMSAIEEKLREGLRRSDDDKGAEELEDEERRRRVRQPSVLPSPLSPTSNAWQESCSGQLWKKNRYTNRWKLKYYAVDTRDLALKRLDREPTPGEPRSANVLAVYPLLDATAVDWSSHSSEPGAFSLVSPAYRTLHFVAESEVQKTQFLVWLNHAAQLALDRRNSDIKHWLSFAGGLAHIKLKLLRRAGGHAAILSTRIKHAAAGSDGEQRTSSGWDFLVSRDVIAMSKRLRLWEALTGFQRPEEGEAEAAAGDGGGGDPVSVFAASHSAWRETVFSYFGARIPYISRSTGLVGVTEQKHDHGPAAGERPASPRQMRERTLLRELLLVDTHLGLPPEQQDTLKLILMSLAHNNPTLEFCPMILQLASQLLAEASPREIYRFLAHLVDESQTGSQRLLVTSPLALATMYLQFRVLVERRFPRVYQAITAAEQPAAREDRTHLWEGELFRWWCSWANELWTCDLPSYTVLKCMDMLFTIGCDALLWSALAAVGLDASLIESAKTEHAIVGALRQISNRSYHPATFFGYMAQLNLQPSDFAESARAASEMVAVPPRVLRYLKFYQDFARDDKGNRRGAADLWAAEDIGQPDIDNLLFVPYVPWATQVRSVSHILAHPYDAVLASFLPDTVASRIVSLQQRPLAIYHSVRDGMGLEQLYRRCAETADDTTNVYILLVRSTDGHVFGAYLTKCPLLPESLERARMERDPHCFVFKLRPLWQARAYYQKAAAALALAASCSEEKLRASESAGGFCTIEFGRDHIGIGPGASGFALFLDQRIKDCESFHADMFANPPLHTDPDETDAVSDSGAINSFFVASEVEIIGFLES